MDRDRRLETKTKLAYDMLVHGTGTLYTSATQAMQSSYDAGIYDEFINPSIINPSMTIQPHDVVIFANFRTDRPRQLTTVLTQQDYPEFGMHTIPLHFVTMTRYDTAYTGLHVVYDTDKPTQTLGELIADAGQTQLRIAETEKYPHVTFFFSG
jgi:2,3-bisphosphoglycerate-independent phosphoglycerate mutase